MAHLPGPPEGCSENPAEAVFGVRRPRVPGLLGAGLGLRVQEMGARRPAPWASLGRGLSEKGLRFCRGRGAGCWRGAQPPTRSANSGPAGAEGTEGKAGSGGDGRRQGWELGGRGSFQTRGLGQASPSRALGSDDLQVVREPAVEVALWGKSTPGRGTAGAEAWDVSKGGLERLGCSPRGDPAPRAPGRALPFTLSGRTRAQPCCPVAGGPGGVKTALSPPGGIGGPRSLLGSRAWGQGTLLTRCIPGSTLRQPPPPPAGAIPGGGVESGNPHF